MFSTRARIAAAATAVTVLATLPVPAAAQANREAVLNILVECAKIDDPTARLACYDNNIRQAGGVARSTVPGAVRAQGGGAPVMPAQGPGGFGAETVRTEQRVRAPDAQVDSIRPKVTAVSMREPGIYLVTIEGGAQWLFTDGVDASFRPPRVGSIVEIDRAAMGSFLMRVDGQEGIRVRRQR
ncbi:MAG: hypothetical protein B7Z08_08675 [Sphingomonadales bacterium 32-68-7]|nr:MAG: hypothetical protein B7Z33_05005 [Sphingomonadales bacterium 12-68-11]OYX08608.1 MAG: hypothetical protein B7Z08_08675 [Sphingomonadales bacterium 32-68-7]